MGANSIGKWIALSFIILFILIVLLVVFGGTIGITISFLVLIFLIITVLFFASRHRLNSSESYPIDDLEDMHNDDFDSVKDSSISENKMKTDFEVVLQSIDSSFNPTYVKNEDDLEQQFLNFLNRRFPERIQRQGHTSSGRKVDVVIDGTYSIELIVVNNEAELAFLMTQINRSKTDFGEVAVILYDIGKVPSSKIEEYVRRYEEIGAKVLIKKGQILENKE